MNNTFNINRFGLLLKRQWLDFGKIYLISFGVLIGALTLFYAINLTEDNLKQFSSNTLNFRYPLFLITGFLFMSIISSGYFMHLGQKPKAIISILIPASGTEKFLTAIFYTVIISIPSYLLCFYLIDLAFVSSIRETHTLTSSYTNYQGKNVIIDNVAYFFATETVSEFYPFCYVPLLVNSVFLLGSIFFQNFHYVKTAISAMLFIVVWVTSIIYIMNKLTESTVWVGNQYLQSKGFSEILMAAVGIFLILVFWFISFLRLKEKEA